MLELLRNLVLQSTVFLAGFLFLMAAVLLAEKTLHNAFDRYRRHRYRLYEDILLLEFAREPPIVHPELYRAKRRGDFWIVERLLLDCAKQFRGSLQEQFRNAFESLGYVDYELAQLKSWRWWLRAQAARRLGEMRSLQAVPALRAALSDRNEDVWYLAALALAQIDQETARQPVYESLSRQWSRHNASYVFEVLVKLGGEALLPHLERFAWHGDVWTATLRALAELKSISAVPFLLLRLAEERSPEDIAEIIATLGRIGDPAASEPLCGLLAASSPEIRQAAAQALGRLQASEARQEVRALLDDPDDWVSFRAGEALATMGAAGRESLEAAVASASAGGSMTARYFLERG